MPANQSIRLDDRQSLSPRKKSGEQDQGQLRSSLCPARFEIALHMQNQLLTKEEAFSGQSAPRLKANPDEAQGIQ